LGRRLFAALGLAATLAHGACAPSVHADPNALWTIVNGKCGPGMAAKRDPSPCLLLDAADGYAVLKDQRGRTQVLVIPTARITGIESPDLLAPASPNYWDDAWKAGRFVAGFAGKPIPREDLALAVNSIDGRSQNQLHIHVDCLDPQVRDAVRAALPDIGGHWRPLAIDLAGHRYEEMRLDGAELGARDPFKLLAEDPAAKTGMGLETLVVVGATFANGTPGFVLLADRANLAAGDIGHGETLMDHTCKALGPAG
jgi:CDP-diacylglycerol pyrophosphatase